ncbi:hypothetical protein CLAFUW4_13551 [Fulvia fulva]|uniref:Uncharacterized protein n=1 Tax=Passalora fulva TaxID=5499 RepID=A0A9Q8UW76_PASFU|nr:uncharacterized protein CLAFUR5_13402 [Fulvia fulva]KAK4610709.1 hypothetical protein CLAFUR4_13553 [Fulvia fulva]KAK4611477.1 hypothetical protein CLAFUR0_13562 [Fulvia fulva]UJO24700.1 hypothetical protein CLAFUR5_13402 [Fulvia fulva]WPV22349.1 hypothetical protein CLAFUW4_13551 [Fulvia fulva]WPV37241.1 hypothetical protein CLAFUW7_13558 [Fulvia fulva]
MPLLQLPSETRTQIYSLVLMQHATIILPDVNILEPSLLQVTRQIRRETESISWSKNTFCISLRNTNSDPLVRLQLKLDRLRATYSIDPDIEVSSSHQVPHCANLMKWLERIHNGTVGLGYPEPKAVYLGADVHLVKEYTVYSIFETVYRHLQDPWEDLRGLVEVQCAALRQLEHRWAMGRVP